VDEAVAGHACFLLGATTHFHSAVADVADRLLTQLRTSFPQVRERSTNHLLVSRFFVLSSIDISDSDKDLFEKVGLGKHGLALSSCECWGSSAERASSYPRFSGPYTGLSERLPGMYILNICAGYIAPPEKASLALCILLHFPSCIALVLNR
jgi:hypothetical protein